MGSNANNHGRKLDRKELILNSASRLFNTLGVGSVRIKDVADELGLKRPAVYYHAKDRASLITACYVRTCEVTHGELLSASQIAGSGLDKLSKFLDLSLPTSSQTLAVLSDVSGLPGDAKLLVWNKLERIVDLLQEIIETGIADGSIRNIPPRLSARYLLGVVWWLPVARFWRYRPREFAVTTHLDNAARQMLLTGIVADRASDHFVLPQTHRKSVKKHDPFDQDEVTQAKILELIRTACVEFNRRGINGASLEHITSKLGVTTGLFYNFFDNKSALVDACYNYSLEALEEIAQTARSTEGLDCSRTGAGVYLNAQAILTGNSPLMPSVGTESLDHHALKGFMQKVTSISKIYEGLLSDGMAEGNVRPLDPMATTLAGAGSFVWLTKWKMDFGAEESHEIAREITDLFLRGFARL